MDTPSAFYSLRNLDQITYRLHEELGGTWEHLSSNEDGHSGWAELTTRDGYVIYRYDTRSWWIETASSNPQAHQRLAVGFLTAIGVDETEASATAETIVSGRLAEGHSCQGPGALEIYTYQDDDGEWITFFNPVLHRFYTVEPAC